MTETDVKVLASELKSQYGDNLNINADRFFTKLLVDKVKLLDLMQLLHDKYGFNQLSNLTSVDYGEEFEMVYHLYSIPENIKICVKTRIPRNMPEADSLITIWPAADWQEREVYDLMGIRFNGHPNLIRVLLPDDFDGHPLRKDFVRKG
ncbi:MAG TPA: NADH-quinone oxidoreductase subunit C [Syntrophomonadaceae bacterium]|mgnify:CR=1 FL=1|nr:NADH-quinone oxidoreductase subunit C [Syntrophomonadaceae bacterium]HPR93533.1 NADH-quinone oxidoreductase subunit C [Syntrophomonadaceae bacterium]